MGCGGGASQPMDQQEGRQAGLAPGLGLPDTLETLDYKVETEVVASGLDMPWAIDFISADTALITEQSGGLRLLIEDELHPDPVEGTPEVYYEGEGGLLDVAVDPEYDQNGWIYLSYSHAVEQEGDTLSMTRLVRGQIQDHTWVEEEVLFEAPRDMYRPSHHHYGSRIVFDSENRLYFSIGDRGEWPVNHTKEYAQHLDRPNGKIFRLHRDGSIPEENPFAHREEALPSIYTFGHRNPQGLSMHPETGTLWALEHGPRGGDELNRLEVGHNYGWPEITYGIGYDGRVISRERRKEGMQQPIYYWRPSIATSGLSFYRGDEFPYWQNQLLVATLRAQELRLLTLDGARVIHQEVLIGDHGRIREAVPGPEGAIYVVFNAPNRVERLTHASDFTARK